MDRSMLHKVAILAVMFAGYLAVTGQDGCGDDPPSPCAGKAEKDLCSFDNSGNLNGYCSQDQCLSGAPEDWINKCMGLSEGDVCKVTNEISGTCVYISKALRCLVIVNLEKSSEELKPTEVWLEPCVGQPDGNDCKTKDDDDGVCEAAVCQAPSGT
jgi:hypothetical protein